MNMATLMYTNGVNTENQSLREMLIKCSKMMHTLKIKDSW
jgi:hypothetical protein